MQLKMHYVSGLKLENVATVFWKTVNCRFTWLHGFKDKLIIPVIVSLIFTK